MPINNQQPNPFVYPTQGQSMNYGATNPPVMPQPQFTQQQQAPMNFSSQPGLSIIQIINDDAVNTYPVASGNTVLFVNFNTNRMCFKSTNVNGVPMAPRWASFTYDEQISQNFSQQNQNAQNGVSREEFDELKAMLAQALSTSQQAQQMQYSPRANYAEEIDDFNRNSRSNGKRGNRNDKPTGASANNG